MECKSGDQAVSPAVRYFAGGAPIPRFFQVPLGTRHFQSGKVTALPFQRFCTNLGMP